MDLQWHWKQPGVSRSGPGGATVLVLIGGIFSLLGLCFLSIGIGSALWTKSFVSKSIPAQGTVVELRQVHDAQNNSTTFAPVVTFQAKDRITYRIVSNSSSNPPGFAIGQSVRVLYTPGNPSSAKIDTVWQLWGISIIFCIVGGVFSPTGLFLLALGWYQKKQQRKAALQSWTANPGPTISSEATWRGGNIDPK